MNTINQTQAQLNTHEQVCAFRYESICARMKRLESIGWVQDALGEEQVASYEANVAQQIADQQDPPVVNPPLPWG